MPLNTLEDAFVHELADIYGAEKQIMRALPKMAKAVSDPSLKQSIEKHMRETEQQLKRLEQCFESFGRKPKAAKCEAMRGILEEGQNLLDEDAPPEVSDAMIIAASQKVEHYEICAYGTLCAWGETLGMDQTVLKNLKSNLAEEKKTDEILNEAASTINAQAAAPVESET